MSEKHWLHDLDMAAVWEQLGGLSKKKHAELIQYVGKQQTYLQQLEERIAALEAEKIKLVKRVAHLELALGRITYEQPESPAEVAKQALESEADDG